MAKRKLYPVSRRDRIIFWLGISYFLLVFMGRLFTPLHWITWTVIGCAFLAWLLAVYINQDLVAETSGEEYSQVIADIEGISKKLSELSEFLKQERQRIAESEAVLRSLKVEKTKLEPVVLAQRDTVNAILEAHTKATASNAWKERALGFTSGLLTSLIASMLYEYLRR